MPANCFKDKPVKSATELIKIHKVKTTYKVHENIQFIQTSTCSLYGIREGDLRRTTTRATKKTMPGRDKKLKDYLARQSAPNLPCESCFAKRGNVGTSLFAPLYKFLTQRAYCS